MRHLQDIDLTTGIGKSKEYGFVTFTTHEHALKALRSVNNNPKIFTPARVIYILYMLLYQIGKSY